jgi:hypothetical protein
MVSRYAEGIGDRDAVHLGLIASEARPGGNVTGIEPYVAGLPAKQMEFAREIAPGATYLFKERTIKAHQHAAEELGISSRQFGAICTTPGNLCLYGTAWWG